MRSTSYFTAPGESLLTARENRVLVWAEESAGAKGEKLKMGKTQA